MFALTEYQNYCGSAICPPMGSRDRHGWANRAGWRPTALMLQLANDAILGYDDRDYDDTDWTGNVQLRQDD